jgi:hypothetical protein
VEFTFYGDLLGIGSAYKLSASAAREKLNAFYNETFHTLDTFCDDELNDVEMFSDSLLITGVDALHALPYISEVFVNLVRKDLLLRGAIVKGKLRYEARVTKENLSKRLPDDDTLARAVGLEKTQKGARFLIERDLANDLLNDVPEWKSHDGYLRSIRTYAYADESLRRICPTPDSTSYEYLYYWSAGVQPEEYAARIKDLRDIKAMCDKTSRKHYEETIAVIRRARQRHEVTLRR